MHIDFIFTPDKFGVGFEISAECAEHIHIRFLLVVFVIDLAFGGPSE